MSLQDRTTTGQPGSAAPVPAVAAHFHLPDLCRITALLPLILVGELLAIALTIATRRPPAFDWIYFSLVSAEILWIVLIGALLLCRLRPLLPRLSAASGVALCFAVLLVTIALVATAGQWLLGYLKPDWGSAAWVVLQHLAVGGIIAGLALRYFFLQQQAQLQALMQARFQSLQSRIRPHFLFNSMNIIASLIGKDPDAAETVVLDLADLFRASLKEAGAEVTLAHELDLCRRYIGIEQLRMGERLKVDWQVGDTPLDDLRIPLLTLQPLLENAVYHGIHPLPAGGTVTVAVSYRDGQVRITVTNPVAPAPGETPGHRGNRMALENIRHRLVALYGPTAKVEGGRRGDTYGTTLQYPFNIRR